MRSILPYTLLDHHENLFLTNSVRFYTIFSSFYVSNPKIKIHHKLTNVLLGQKVSKPFNWFHTVYIKNKILYERGKSSVN